MPTSLTLFAAQYLVFLEAILAAVLVVFALRYAAHARIVEWAVATGMTAIVAGLLAVAGGRVYTDPRPFAEHHFRPLLAHAADNGFPSDHALLGAFLVAVVLFAAPRLAILPAILAVLVDWARVGAGIHHVIDVVGSSLMVAIAALIASLVAPWISRRLLPYVPSALTLERYRLDRAIGRR